MSDISLLNPRLVEALHELNKSPDPTILQYDFFVNHDLPKLVGDGETDVPIREWVRIARGFYNPVHVYRNGVLVYVVPPLCNRKKTHIDKVKGIGLEDIIAESKRVARINPAKAAQIINAGYDYKYTEDMTDQIVASVNAWNLILKDHGYPLVQLNTGTRNESIVYEEQPLDEEFDML